MSYGLESQMAYHDEKTTFIELIGGKDMPLEAFTHETNYKYYSAGKISQKLVNAGDGTTRLYITIQDQ